MRLKPGVKLKGLSPQAVLIALIVDRAYADYNHETTITSANEGNHMEGSSHFKGEALDFRTKDLPPTVDKHMLRNEIKADLGDEFDVILENFGGDNEHIHVEWDVK